MSKFKSYAERVNSIAKSAFENYKDATRKLEEAESNYRVLASPYNDPAKKDYELQAKIVNAKADVEEAQNEVKKAKEFMQSEAASIRVVKAELQKAIDAEYSANGEDVDIATLELLKSGALKPMEYISLYETAERNGNYTMQRIIGKFAGEVANKAPTYELQKRLNSISVVSKYGSIGKAHMEAFEVLEDIYSRTAKNPAMIDRWGELTDSIIAEF